MGRNKAGGPGIRTAARSSRVIERAGESGRASSRRQRRFPWRWKMAARSRQRSSAPLQVLLFLNGWYSATYFLLEAFIFAYKVLLLPYPLTNLLLDVLLLLLYLGIEATRIFFDLRPASGGHPQRHPPALLLRGAAAGRPGARLLL
eukprot:XP_025006980.1 transmembrane protein 216 isoform X2 [Gallus gallus]